MILQQMNIPMAPRSLGKEPPQGHKAALTHGQCSSPTFSLEPQCQ